MKKLLAAAAAAATLTVSSATVFAAANPFEDVPADHWAYDAVAQLAADGVIEGYGDGTYRGNQEITRYEMAQMVARAMAKNNVSGADKAMIDKLAAEFADELNSLGVRVAALEKKVDNVKWKGWVGYEYWNDKHEGDHHYNLQRFQFQLNPVVTINKNWQGRARLKYLSDANTASNATGNSTDDSGFQMDRVWAQGNYDNLTIRLGKVSYETALDRGLVLGNRVTGGIITFGNKLKTTIGIGRQARDPNRSRQSTTDNLQFIEFGYKASDRLNIGAAYYHLSNKSAYNHADGVSTGRFWKAWDNTTDAFGSNSRNIWEVGLTYKFSPKFDTNLAYARSNGHWASKYKQAYTIEFSYNGGRYPEMKRGNFGAFIAYRHLGRGAVIFPTYDETYTFTNNYSVKGVNLGAAYVFDKNVMGTVLYFFGKELGDTKNRDTSTLYTTLQFFF
ncbi:MAG: S-layer homology domain-containing protein [Schwartzia sp.]|nr:S-layer homology domain-containing protein [Schwartzia sp. (in: firmicutes)]